MGQITQPAAPGITVIPVDRQTGPSAGAGNTGDDVIFFGANAGNNNTGNMSIALGNSALGGGNIAPGAIAIGYQAGHKINSQRLSGIDLIIGTQAMAAATACGDNLVIGNFAMQNVIASTGGIQFYHNVVLGNYALQNFNVNYPNNGGILYSVAIGYELGNSAGFLGECTWTQSNVIGCQALASMGTSGVNNALTSSDIIGFNAVPNWAGNSIEQSVLIGQSVFANAHGAANPLTGAAVYNTVAVGAAANCPPGGYPAFCTVIGANALSANNNSIAIGYQAGRQGATANYPGDHSVFIGCNAGVQGSQGSAYDFLLEVGDTNSGFTLMYGQINTGNLALGNLPYADRDFSTIACTNALKLTNGTRGAGNPVGGGFFYCSAGALHWVGTSGTDTTIAPA